MRLSPGRMALLASAMSPSIVNVALAKTVPLNYHVVRSSNDTEGVPVPNPGSVESSISSADAPSPTDHDEYTDAPEPSESEEDPIDDPEPTDWVSSDIDLSSSTSSTFSFPGLGPVTITTSIVPISFTHVTPSSTSSTSTELTCQEQDPYSPTTIVVTHTETTTFYGEPSDYTPPHPEITLPPICDPRGGTDDDDDGDNTGNDIDTETNFPEEGVTPPAEEEPFPSETYTFVTTDKNPSVVFSPSKAPGFGHGTLENHLGATQEAPNAPGNDHLRPPITKSPGQPAPDSPTGGNRPPVQAPPVPTGVIVTAEPGRVIIDDKTISLKPDQTTKTNINGEDFVIDHNKVVGGGHTVHRPWFGDGSGGNGPVVPSRTWVGTVPVHMAPSGTRSAAIIGGTRISIPEAGTTTVVAGTTVSLDPTAIHFPEKKIELRNVEPTPTEVLVEGGQMITALGQSRVVIEGTTLTYGGPGAEPTTTTIGEDVVVLGPSGVVVGSKTLGGPSATPDATSYKIVGGVAVTQIGNSLVAIAGETYTVGPDMKSTVTTDIGGEVITIGPEGVVIDETMSMTYPFGPQVVSTFTPDRALSAAASQTADPDSKESEDGDDDDDDEDGDGKTTTKDKDDDDDDDDSGDSSSSSGNGGSSGNNDGDGRKDENGGVSLRMDTAVLSVSICIAMGVWNML